MQNINESLANYINHLRIKENISYDAIAYNCNCDSKTVRCFINKVPAKHANIRGIRLETANSLLKCFGKTWQDFHNFLNE